MATPITIKDLAIYRGATPDEQGRLSGGEFYRVGLDIMGGCAVCGATLGAYNGCPSKSGYWLCANGCIGDDGWTDVAEANQDIFDGEMPETEEA